MSCDLIDLWDGQAERSSDAARRAAPRALRELAAYKRPSVRAPLVSVSTTSAHPCGGRWFRPGVLLQVTAVGGPP